MSRQRADAAYMPALDGVRALAIAAVLAFHAGISGASGGFLGVDVFFVLSGYLITHLLLVERARDGSIDVRSFYVRRFRRLYPALLVMLAVTTAAATVITADAGAITWRDLPMAIASVTNWWLIVHQQSYFESFGRPELLQHTWSLSIEWQFYLVWPLLLAVAAKAGGRRAVAVVAAGLALAVAAHTALVGFSPAFSTTAVQSYFYYSTATRSIGLLLGAFLASVLVVRSGRAPHFEVAFRDLVAVFAICALALLVRFVSFADPASYRIGFGTASLATVALLWAVSRRGTLCGKLLSIAPVRYVGTRSYGIYLWHWPIFAMLRPGIDVRLDNLEANLLRVTLTLAIAELSYRWVEVPMRRFRFSSLLRDIERSGLVATTLVCVSCFNAVLVAGILQQSASGSSSQSDAAVRAAFALPVLQPRTLRKAGRPWRSADVAAFSRSLTPRGTSLPRMPKAPYDGVATVTVLARGPVPRAPGGPTQRAERLLQHPLPTDTPVAVAAVRVASAAPSALAFAAAATAVAHAPSTRPAQIAAAPVRETAAPDSPAYQTEDATLLGDSIMLAASRAIAERFRVVNVDAAVGRQADALAAVVSGLHSENKLTPIVILDLGNNGTVQGSTLGGMLDAMSGCDRVVVVNAHVPRSWQDDANATVSEVAARYPNVVVADWHYAADGHPEYFGDDGVHPGVTGAKAYAETIVESLARSRPPVLETKTKDDPVSAEVAR